ncbi:RHS repeat domain-containing protein [Flavobacterium davisii]|uniref:RHS repeat-associated core domain-containing protein n=1 Tax=Flavobacterium columnare TaxID=996 RepID=A0A8G0KQI4_9FLAO|nr:RHS repeat-associated core domain-containing protein [Flavobacterium davisii]QYS88241.1 RHS repeat-associated core domain-containing protein [Flavobacterium davisii]
MHKDYLGTILAITDDKGKLVEERHFDAWGNLTHGSMQILDRGYTSHEHLQDVGLIHMNGRLYDPMLRRFLNADEHIQDPTNTQCYNKYGYVMNNPLMFNDPDGEIAIAIVVVGAVVGAYFAAAQANGTYNPFKWNWSSSATWESMVFGGAIGAISSVVGGWAGPYLSGVIAPSAGGFFGGALSAGLGGLAGGFVSGSLGSLVFGGGNPIVDGLRSAAFGFVAGGLIGGVSQGISSSLKGGNFWTGKMPPVEVLSSSLQPQGLQPLQGATLEATDIEIPKPAAVSNGQGSNSLAKHTYNSAPRVLTQKSTINPFDEGKGLRSMRIPRVEVPKAPVHKVVEQTSEVLERVDNVSSTSIREFSGAVKVTGGEGMPNSAYEYLSPNGKPISKYFYNDSGKMQFEINYKPHNMGGVHGHYLSVPGSISSGHLPENHIPFILIPKKYF